MKRLTAFRVLLVGVLLGLAVAWAASERDVRQLELELQDIATEREAFYREVAEVVEGGESKFDVVAVVTVTREFGLVGSPSGKITVYQRSPEPIGHHHPSDEPDSEHEEEHDADDEDARYFSGIQYFYEKVQGEWVNTESGQCSSEECQTVGREAFERSGI